MIRRLRKFYYSYPYRRRRFWRYVSPGRQGAGMIILALVLMLTYGYWYLTNDNRIRRQAEQYIQQLTGGKVKIHRASFRFFEGIELSRVRLYLPKGDSPDPFFTAREVILRHRPWSLFRGQLEPTEIVCLDPVLTLERDMATGEVNAQQLLPILGTSSVAQGPGPAQLPSVTFRRCTFRIVKVDGSMRQTEEKHIDMSVVPEGPYQCTFVFEEQGQDDLTEIQGTIKMNLKTGEKVVAGQIPIGDTIIALPQPYIEWLSLYKIVGQIRFTGKASADGQTDLWELELVDAGLTLPPLQGGLAMEHVKGKIEVAPTGVTIRSLKGKLKQAGQASLELSGSFDNFTAASPFAIKASITGLEIPSAKKLTGLMSMMLSASEKVLRAEGKADLELNVSRDLAGKVAFSGQARPQGMALTLSMLPYRLENMTGLIDFDGQKFRFHDLTASHGSSKLRLGGWAELDERGLGYDLQLEGRDIKFDAELENTMPPRALHIWKRLSPGGMGSFSGRLWQEPGRDMQADMALHLDGRASMKYIDFAYPLEELLGVVRYRDDTISFESLTARYGPMRCSIAGSIKEISGHTDTSMTITVSNMPLDQNLIDAMGKSGRDMFDSLRPQGTARRAVAEIREPKGGKLHFNVQAEFDDVQITPLACPYRLDKAKGRIEVTNEQVVVHELSGWHGASQISIKGTVGLQGEQTALNLSLASPSMPLDQDLFQAVPPDVRRMWTKLAPTGSMALEMDLHRSAKAGQDIVYRAQITPLGGSLKYDEFPYLFRNVRGSAIATPGRVEFKNMTASWDNCHASLNGTVLTGDAGDSAKLSVKADRLPVDAALLKALPSELAVLGSHIKPGGLCSVKFSELTLGRKASPATAPATTSAPASTTTSAPLQQLDWTVRGTAEFEDTVIELGQDDKKFTGRFSGTAGRSTDGLEVDAHIDLEHLKVGLREVTDLKGRIIKNGKSPLLRLEDITGRSCGGMMTGAAQIKLAERLEYGARLDFDAMDLDQLVNAGLAEKDKAAVSGKLSGRVQYSVRPGSKPARQATGQLWVTQAKLGKMPVMLDMLHVLHLAMPKEGVFNEGSLSYNLRDSKLVLEEVFFTGPALSVLGSGSVNMDNERLRLTFLTGPGGKIPRMGLLTELMQGLSREITEVRVTGTVKEPRITTVSLRGLDDVVRTLLNPAEDK